MHLTRMDIEKPTDGLRSQLSHLFIESVSIRFIVSVTQIEAILRIINENLPIHPIVKQIYHHRFPLTVAHVWAAPDIKKSAAKTAFAATDGT